jgi:hypothetical protein
MDEERTRNKRNETKQTKRSSFSFVSFHFVCFVLSLHNHQEGGALVLGIPANRYPQAAKDSQHFLIEVAQTEIHDNA